ncbi:MAG: hypothetical protein EXS64_19560 [Candidatus Latescibacteria bacterium]|nr:hypothetical protein [Candidatus Latescibacterota bacterium]
MKTFVIGSLLVLLCLPAFARAENTGRTDGPEKSEYGKGGYPFGARVGRLYVTPAFGSGFFDAPPQKNETGLLYGLDLGYEMDEWVALQGSYHYLTDRAMSLFGLGSRFTYRQLPFAYHISVQAGLYAPRTGPTNFGLAPGAGIDVVLHERVQVGLSYCHDFIFSDVRSHLNRVYATVGIYF